MNTFASALGEGFLFTDLYQLTMAQLYFRQGMHDTEAQFEYSFRHYPDYGAHQAGYCICAGLGTFLSWMRQARVSDEVVSHLAAHTSRSGGRLFDDDFLTWLRHEASFDELHIHAIEEGRVIHPHVPVIRIRGPLAMAQIVESPLLNTVNYQTLIATKASRISQVVPEQTTLEFGMRRGPGKGANAAARAALIGGIDFSSNTGISYEMGFQPKGTQAHSMIQAFIARGDTEIDAFRAYAQLYPDDCLLLVDTIDTLHSGIPNAITVFEELHKKGHRPVGIRLDSGDLAYLSIRAAKMLDDAGFPDTVIVLSNQLDEMVIWQILSQIRNEAARHGVDPEQLIKRLVYGIGTRLITSRGDSSLDGVYKLAAIRQNGTWRPAFKLSDSKIKTITPGGKSLWRIYDTRHKAVADVIARDDETITPDRDLFLQHPFDPEVHRTLKRVDIHTVERLAEHMRPDAAGITDKDAIAQMRQRRAKDLQALDPGVQRFIMPHRYHVSLTARLWKIKQDHISRATNDTAAG